MSNPQSDTRVIKSYGPKVSQALSILFYTSTVISSVSVHPVTSMTCLAFEPLSSNLAVLVRHSRQDVCRLEKQLGFTHYQRRQRVDATAHTAAAEAEKQPLPLLSNFMNKVVIGMRV